MAFKHRIQTSRCFTDGSTQHHAICYTLYRSITKLDLYEG
jgi:hypothetical protein